MLLKKQMLRKKEAQNEMGYLGSMVCETVISKISHRLTLMILTLLCSQQQRKTAKVSEGAVFKVNAENINSADKNYIGSLLKVIQTGKGRKNIYILTQNQGSFNYAFFYYFSYFLFKATYISLILK